MFRVLKPVGLVQTHSPMAADEGIQVGTSGWSYSHWRGAFYPPALADSRWLEFLSAVFGTVEVNATFYSLTTPRACDSWRAAVPPDFVFALKGSRYISHMKQLRDVGVALSNFFASGILRLGAQLGPILWQLPPRLKFARDRASEFFGGLPRDLRAAERLARGHDARVLGRPCLAAPDGHDNPIRYALEARHPSWMEPEAVDLLRTHGIALVWADTAGEHPSASTQTSDDLAYVRLHGSRTIYEGRYESGELEIWAGRARQWARSGTPVFIYFDNDRDAAAPLDARRLSAMIAGKSEPPESTPAERQHVDRTARRKPRHFGFGSARPQP